MTFCAILVAAGSGTRFGAPKHTSLLNGRTLWEMGRSCLVDAGASAVVVVGAVDGGIAGGLRRRDSVAAGLQALPAGCEFVLVHDAARPLATPELAISVFERLAAGGVDGVIPALELADAIKRLEGDGTVSAVDRSTLRAVQTPQGFLVESLRAAHTEVEGDAADDAELIERWGGKVVTVAGERTNLKITYQSDLTVAATLVAAR